MGLSEIPEYKSDGVDLSVTDSMKQSFKQYGFFVVRSLVSEAELAKLRLSLEESEQVRKNSFLVEDEEEGEARMCLWNHPGHDVPGMLARCDKVAGTCEQLLGGDVYHYHTKLNMKDPFKGGTFVWHQDYGYWYKNGCLFPDMMTVFLAVDKCTKENGCLQVLSGSHLCGRVEHTPVGKQWQACLDRVQHLEKKCPRVFVELQPGDALFFHCNLLHTSSPNHSALRRWALLFAYNMAANDPVYEHHHPRYTKMTKVPNSAILECEVLWDADKNKDFQNDHSEEDADAARNK